MAGDHADFYGVTDPGVTRWAPGTSFGGITYSGNLAALSIINIDFDTPNDDLTYVLDTVFIRTKIIGAMEWHIYFAENAGAPSYALRASGEDNKVAYIKPFSLVSMAVQYPNRIRTTIYNSNLFTRAIELCISCYNYA
jgi:hypothetical protein